MYKRQRLGYDPQLTAHVLADASHIKAWHDNTILYLDGLVGEAGRITEEKKVSYGELDEIPRRKLVGFLYRPPTQRLLTFREKLRILYPDFFSQVPAETKKCDWVLNVNRKGLQKVLRCRLEYQELELHKDDVVQRLWGERGWLEYIQEVKSPDEAKRRSGEKAWIDCFNLPDDIEYIASDVRIYLDTGLNLRKLVYETEKILPYRKKLDDEKYFLRERTNEGLRHSMLRRIFDDIF